MGQGGVGTGSGTGVGAGDGPGRGVRTGPRNIRQPGPGQVRRYHPREALARQISGTGIVRCQIRLDTRLDRCAVVSENPSGLGFGQAAIQAAEQEYRFRPAMIDGQPDDSVTVVVTIRFGPPEEPVG